MTTPLSQAPHDVPLVLEAVSNAALAKRFERLGLSPGAVVTRTGDEAVAAPVRVSTPKGEAILASGMAAKVIVHHDDGHKTPVSEMRPGETGHVEGLVCGSTLECGLRLLGIRENDSIVMLRRVPPMDYTAIRSGARLTLPEGAAAKLWGESRGRETQFAMSGAGEPFVIKAFLGGPRATAALESMGLGPGVELTLESVRPAASEGRRAKDQTVLTTQSGLRLYLRKDMEASVLVRVLNRQT